MNKHRYGDPHSRDTDPAFKVLRYVEESLKHLRLMKEAQDRGDLQASLKHGLEAKKYVERAEALAAKLD